jgi:hypothetical protein
MSFLKKIFTFKPKMAFLKPLVIFTNLQRIKKKLNPSTRLDFWNELAAPRIFKIIKNGL